MLHNLFVTIRSIVLIFRILETYSFLMTFLREYSGQKSFKHESVIPALKSPYKKKLSKLENEIQVLLGKHQSELVKNCYEGY